MTRQAVGVKTKFVAILISVLIICVICVCIPSLNPASASQFSAGRTAGESVFLGDRTFVAEDAQITFDVQRIVGPDDKIDEVPLTAKATYTLFNPTDTDAVATGYIKRVSAPGYYKGSVPEVVVRADGEALSGRTRYTRAAYDREGYEKNLAALRDALVYEQEFAPDTTVYVSRFVVTDGMPENALPYVSIRYTGDAPLICDGWTSIGDDVFLAEYGVTDGSFTVYSIGAPFSAAYDVYAIESTGSNQESKKVKVSVTASVTVTLGQYVKEQTGAGADVFVDVYNAVAADLASGAKAFDRESLVGEESFDSWYEHSLTIPAGERVIYETETAVFPTVRYLYRTLNEYVAEIADFEKAEDFVVDVTVNTDAYFHNGNDFKKADGGYVAHYESSTIRRVSFSLSDERVDEFSDFVEGMTFFTAFIMYIYALIGAGIALSTVPYLLAAHGVLLLIALIVGITVYSCDKKRRKKREGDKKPQASDGDKEGESEGETEIEAKPDDVPKEDLSSEGEDAKKKDTDCAEKENGASQDVKP